MTTEPKLPHLPDHPEPQTMTWSGVEAAAIEAYGLQCFEAGRPQWLPIETAPKDGTVVILWSKADARFDENGNGGRWLGQWLAHIGVGMWVSTIPTLDEWNEGGGWLTLNPTHWMPLPEPPKA